LFNELFKRLLYLLASDLIPPRGNSQAGFEDGKESTSKTASEKETLVW
jgi:hypothetical protein